MARISIIGSGVVGTAVGMGLKRLRDDVIFYDLDDVRVEELLSLGLNATTGLKSAIHKSDISFLCVPTPTRGGKMDIGNLKEATEDVARSLKSKGSYHVVVVKSTVLPTTTEKVIVPLLQIHSGKKAGEGIGVCVNPEFLTQVHRSWSDDDSFARDFLREERVVIGELDQKAGDTLEALYKPLNIPIIRTNPNTAEMIKYASNCALASRISYWNEIYYICQRLGIDSSLVARVVGMDKRIGRYGTVHGKAFGGKCLPKDLDAFINFVKELGYQPKLLEAIREINERIKAERGIRE